VSGSLTIIAAGLFAAQCDVALFPASATHFWLPWIRNKHDFSPDPKRRRNCSREPHPCGANPTRNTGRHAHVAAQGQDPPIMGETPDNYGVRRLRKHLVNLDDHSFKVGIADKKRHVSESDHTFLEDMVLRCSRRKRDTPGAVRPPVLD